MTTENRLQDESKVYGRLTLTGITFLKQGKKQRRRVVQAKCECGVIKFYDFDLIKRGETKSCGCLKVDVARERGMKHGLSTHPLYKVWIRLKEKCNTPTSKAYRNYGAKGVKLDEVWEKDYVAFYNWAIANGWEDGLQIDKDKLYIEKFGTKTGFLYSPEYCCFLTQRENKRYTSRSNFIEYNGEKKTLSEWARELGAERSVLSNRMKHYGWSIEKALSTPLGKKGKNKKRLSP